MAFIGSVPAFSQAEEVPNIPKPNDIHAGFMGEDMYGPSKTTARIFDSAEALVSSMAQATYLGRDIDIQDPRWLGKTDEYFDQRWLIISKSKEGMSIEIWKAQGSSNRILCRVTYFDEKTRDKSGPRHQYYYELPNKK